jgi:hypothetical protein
MKVQQYDPTTLQLIKDSATGLDFGVLFQGNPSPDLALIKPMPTIENNFLSLEMFLQNNGGLSQSQFRYLFQNEPLSIPSRDQITGSFSLVQNPSTSDSGSASFDPENPQFAWLDISVGDKETSQSSDVNYTFVFEYN